MSSARSGSYHTTFFEYPTSPEDFDPKAHGEPKKSPNPSEISIQRHSRNDLETPTFDPEQHFIDPEKIF